MAATFALELNYPNAYNHELICTFQLVDQPGFFMAVVKQKHFSHHLRQAVLLFLVMELLSGCGLSDIPALFTKKPAGPELMVPKVLAVWPHDPGSFTEGLVWYNGFLYESSGLYGKSNFRKVDPQTGLVVQRKDNPSQDFGEGLALSGDRLFQLTWRENIGYIYNVDNFAQIGTIAYAGEGWGLCFDGQYFYMSDGSAVLQRRDPKTFALMDSIQVMQNGKPINMLNELECVGDWVYANVWKTNNILRIDKRTGEVAAVNVFLITGELWPKLFEVEFVPKGGG